MENTNFKMGERFIPSIKEWPEDSRKMFLANYVWASQFVEDKIILDCACGSGYGSDILSNRANQVIGADVDFGIINYAKKNYPKSNIQFHNFSSIAIPYPDNYFDVIVSFDTIEHVIDDDKMLLEFKRVTKPDGIIIISTPLRYYRIDQGDKELFDNTHIREYSAYEWCNLLTHFFQHGDFFSRDSDFNFHKINPENYSGSPFEVGHVILYNRFLNENTINQIKHKISVHLTIKIKDLEKELFFCQEELKKLNSFKNLLKLMIKKIQRKFFS
ncbi:MAG: hypothetical protein CL609_18580 [Anaerolineaceae bacterium]|nr:hypothetical protein [Anaerolineaceae bacterium]